MTRFHGAVVSDAAPQRSSGRVVRLPIESDQAIVEALLAGSAAGGSALYDRHHRYVRRVLTRVLGPDDQICDLIQDVFVTAIDSVERLEDPGALRSWLASIAVFRARAEIRRRRRQRWFTTAEPEEPEDPGAPAADSDVGAALRATYEVMERLAPDERIAFALRYVEGMELTEVASATRVSLATVKRRLRRAQDKFCTIARMHPALREWVGGLKWT